MAETAKRSRTRTKINRVGWEFWWFPFPSFPGVCQTRSLTFKINFFGSHLSRGNRLDSECCKADTWIGMVEDSALENFQEAAANWNWRDAPLIWQLEPPWNVEFQLLSAPGRADPSWAVGAAHPVTTDSTNQLPHSGAAWKNSGLFSFILTPPDSTESMGR